MNILLTTKNVFLKILGGFLVLALASFFLAGVTADAHEDPGACFSNGVGLSIAAYRADGVTPIGGGSVEPGETVKYEATLSHLGGSNCNFEDGSLTITTPDGTPHIVASGAGIPLVTFGAPFVAPQQSYVANGNDMIGGFLNTEADYVGGISHTPNQHQNAQAGVDIATPFQEVTLEVTKTAEPAAEETYEWSIEKSVSPDTWDLFTGDTGMSEYTVDLQKTLAGTTYSVGGTISIYNPATFATASITDVADEISGVGAVSVTCPEAAPFDLGPGETVECTYDTVLPDNSVRTNTAMVTTGGNVNGDSDEVVFDPSQVVPTVVNDTVTVDDTYDEGDAGPFSESTSYTYEHTFECDADEGENHNTATIVETQQSDDATVTVNCYQLSVEKTAETTFDRTYLWDIEKTGSETELTLAEGESYDVDYDVTVDVVGHEDSNWMVSGTITVTNPNPSLDAVLGNWTDTISPDIAGAINFGTCTGAPDLVPANGSISCDYGPVALPDGSERTNTAEVEQYHSDYDKDGIPTPSGTSTVLGNTSVAFGDPTNEYDTSVDVNDTLGGFLGTVTIDEAPKTFSYTHTVLFEGEEACGEHTVDNIADFITNDSGAVGDDTWSVAVNVPCEFGCTLTQGYWKTHNESFHGGAPADDTWQQIVDMAEQTDFGWGDSWFDIFWTPPKGGNVWYQLSHQWMAATLNSLNGASTDALGTALADAENWLLNNDPSAKLKGKDAGEAKDWASLFANYNEGSIGPGHCDEQVPE